jgi:hypothetical protein
MIMTRVMMGQAPLASAIGTSGVPNTAFQFFSSFFSECFLILSELNCQQLSLSLSLL